MRSGRGRKKREPSVLGTSIPAALSNNLVKGVCPGRGMPRKKNAGISNATDCLNRVAMGIMKMKYGSFSLISRQINKVKKKSMGISHG